MKFTLTPFIKKEKDFHASHLDANAASGVQRTYEKTTPLFARPLSRSLMRINLITLLIGLGLSQVDAHTYAQQISLKKQKSSLESILKNLEKQSGYSFFYKKNEINQIIDLSAEIKEMPFKQALNVILSKANLSYDFFDKTIVVKKGKSKFISFPNPDTSIPFVAPVLQQQYIQGKVTDEDGKPLAGASLRLKSDSRKGVQTQSDGSFNLPLSANGEIIIVSIIGYQSQEIHVKSKVDKITVKLKKINNSLEEVVIRTGIFKKDENSFTGASRTITAEELKQFGTRNLVTSIRNIDPSFNIIESNQFGSNPNRMPEIQLRGNSNIPNVGQLQDESRAQLNTPLIILNGFQSTLQKLIDINENDVESITILKDASATAMYGSRGANGVIVITTKRPLPGKLRISFGSQLNIETPDISDYNLLNSRDKLELERLAGYYNDVQPSSDFTLKKYYNYILGEVNRGVETDWLSIPLRTSVGQRHNLRLEGGENAFRYSTSVQYNNIAGVMKGSGRNTFNGEITLSYILPKVRFQNNTQYAQGNSAESPYGSFGDYSKLNPYWNPYDNNGNVSKRLGDPGNLDYQGFWTTLPTNPLYNAELKTYDKSNYSEIINNTSVEWKILSDLIFRTQFGITKQISQSDRFRPGDHTAFANYGVDDMFRKGDYRYGVGNQLRYDGSANIGYNKVFANKHNIYLAADFNVRQDKASNYSFLAEGFANARLDFIGSALQYAKGGTPTGTESFNRAVGLSTNATYSYDNRYFADFLFRRDGSSQFGSKRRFAPFWSAGLAWNVHEESFLKDATLINRLKLRGSTGIVGSQNFSAYQAMASYSYYTGDNYLNWGGAYLLGLGNDELLWQQAQKHNIGADIELLNRRIKIRTDIYQETTKDLLSSINLPASNGFPSYVENIGEMRNRGFETQLTFILLNNPSGLFWSVTGNLLTNRNKILKTSKALKDALQAVKNNSTDPGTIYEEGYSSNTIWVVPSLGIDPSNGKEVYRDIQGNSTYNWSGQDVVPSGSTEAKLFGNFSTLLRYKNFTLNTVFRFTTGAQQYNSTLAGKVEARDYKYQMDSRVLYDRWQQPGDNTYFRGILVTTPVYKTSRFVQNENTLVLSNVNLQYNLTNKAWMQRLGLSSLNVAGNISDPVYISTIRRERGTSYPFSRQFSLSFNATF